MAANTGRTVSKFVRFLIDDSAGTLREVPIDTLSVVGVVYDETDLTAFQDAVKGSLPNMPDAPIEFGGPWDTAAAQAAGGSAAAPALSGSHTVLYDLAGAMTPLTLDIRIGVRHYWETGEPQFGVTSSAANGYLVTSYTFDPATSRYSARAVLYPGSIIPAWGTAAEV